MKILVIGSGAREHAIIRRLLADAASHEVVCAPGNAGIARDVAVVPLDAQSPDAVAAHLREHPADLVIVGPEAPLIAGVADAVRSIGIPVFGPSGQAAQLEGSKAFAKAVMTAANVPTGGAVRAATLDAVVDAVDAFGAPYVIKADGLAAGKGVLVTEDREAALEHARTWLPSGPVLVEEFLAGREVSLFFLADGATVVPLEPGQDYKRQLDGDEGPNTGGMGAYSPLPWLPGGFIEGVQRDVAQPVVSQLAAQGTPFVGLLYCGLILTDEGVKVIEFNARFGDPETQVILPRLEGEFGELLLAAAEGRLDAAQPPTFSDRAAVTVVLASEGYPAHALTGRTLTGVRAAEALAGVSVIHAATAEPEAGTDDGDAYVATGGRVLNVVAEADTIGQARALAYEGIALIHLDGGQYRTDIAKGVEEA